ncbi:MAG: dihydrofolate reductase family protein [Pseudomonadota bacterium]
MKCSVFIACSADGYIATSDGATAWLESSGDTSADLGADSDMGFARFIASVDCMIMGRRTLEAIADMNLSDEQWPYGDICLALLSRTLKTVPGPLHDRVEFVQSDIRQLLAKLEARGCCHAYVDGGATISAFLEEKLIDEMTITIAPVLLGDGLPLFHRLASSIKLENARAKVFANGFIQIQYTVAHAPA